METTAPITATPAALQHLKELLAAEPSGARLRVAVTGGGCSGFQYALGFDTQEHDDDQIVECGDGVELIVDDMSLEYLLGASIDFTSGLQGKGFEFSNPNSTSSCGCGQSFSC